MPLLLVLIALFVPRIVIALLWFFTNWFTGVMPHWVLGVLGFMFLPYTLLWYSAVHHWFGGTWGPLQVIILVIAVLADLGVTGGTRYRRGEVQA
jgi:hypothetical protein